MAVLQQDQLLHRDPVPIEGFDRHGLQGILAQPARDLLQRLNVNYDIFGLPPEDTFKQDVLVGSQDDTLQGLLRPCTSSNSLAGSIDCCLGGFSMLSAAGAELKKPNIEG